MNSYRPEENSIMFALQFQIKATETGGRLLLHRQSLCFHTHVHGEVCQPTPEWCFPTALLLQAIHLGQEVFVTPHTGQIQGSLLGLGLDFQSVVVPFVEQQGALNMPPHTGPGQRREPVDILAEGVQFGFQNDMWILRPPIEHGSHQLGVAQSGCQMKETHATQAHRPGCRSAGQAPGVFGQFVAIGHQFLLEVRLQIQSSVIGLEIN